MSSLAFDKLFDVLDLSRTTARDVVRRLRSTTESVVPPETEQQALERRADERRAAAEELARTEAERDRELPKLAAAEAKARKRLEDVTPAYQQALADLDRAQMIHSRRAHNYGYARDTLIRRINIAAEPVIDQFLNDLTALFEANLKTPVSTNVSVVGFDVRRGVPIREEWSNKHSINARRIAILAARHTAEEMKADPDQSNIQERLIKLVEDLPDNLVIEKVGES